MSISHYIKDIGRGKDGARSLNRAQATDLFGQVLDGTVTDLEVGAFCQAMCIKGGNAHRAGGFSGCRAPAPAHHPQPCVPHRGAAQLQRRTQTAGADTADAGSAARVGLRNPARWIRAVLNDQIAVPTPIATQVAHIVLPCTAAK